MANIENIVKVMNFHSLLRVDKSRKTAEKYFAVEAKIKQVIGEVFYNKNLILDQKLITEKNNGDILNIYIGNDLGFCGSFNSSVAAELRKDNDSNVYKIVVGKRIFKAQEKVLLKIEKDDFNKQFIRVQDLIYHYINERKLKELNVIYNHYYNTNDIRFEITRLFPIELDKPENANLDCDFTSETNINSVLSGLLSYYLCYQILIAEKNSEASENVMREKTTHESLKKIEEINENNLKEFRKKKRSISFKKQLANYRKADE